MYDHPSTAESSPKAGRERGGRTPVCTASDFKDECNNVKHTL